MSSAASNGPTGVAVSSAAGSPRAAAAAAPAARRRMPSQLVSRARGSTPASDSSYAFAVASGVACDAAALASVPTPTLATPDGRGEGSYTLVVSAEDPNAHDGRFRGVWLDTAGHAAGTMCFRYVAPDVDDALLPQPRCEVLELAELLAEPP